MKIDFLKNKYKVFFPVRIFQEPFEVFKLDGVLIGFLDLIVHFFRAPSKGQRYQKE